MKKLLVNYNFLFISLLGCWPIITFSQHHFAVLSDIMEKLNYTEGECSQQLKDLEEIKLAKVPHNNCYYYALDGAYMTAIDQQKDRSVLILGRSNYLIFQRRIPSHSSPDYYSTQSVQSEYLYGPASQLNNIRAVAIHHEKKEVAVLDTGTGKVLTFPTEFAGLLAPLRVQTHREFENGTDLIVDQKNDQIIVLVPTEKTLYFVPRLGSDKAKSPVPKITIHGDKTQLDQPISLEIDNEAGLLFVLEDQSKKILIFDLSYHGNIAPVATINISTVEAPQTIALMPGHQIRVIGPNRVIRIFPYHTNLK